MGFKRWQTIADLIRARCTLQARCRTCGHCAQIEPTALLLHFGRMAHWKRMRFRCQRCASRQVDVRLGL